MFIQQINQLAVGLAHARMDFPLNADVESAATAGYTVAVQDDLTVIDAGNNLLQ